MRQNFHGRQTQFYIDLVYGIAFALGFGYLLFVGMDGRVAAFQGGLVFGYFLRVWENMTVYERILEEEVAREAEEAVADEVETQVPSEAEEAVADEIDAQISDEAEEAVADEIDEQITDEVGDRITTEAEEQLADDAETVLLERFEEVDEELATKLRNRLDERSKPERAGE